MLPGFFALVSNPFDSNAMTAIKSSGSIPNLCEIFTTSLSENMSGMKQLEYVYRFYEPNAGKMQNLGDLYMVTLWPSGLGENDSYVLFRMGSNEYEKNDKLDADQ